MDWGQDFNDAMESDAIENAKDYGVHLAQTLDSKTYGSPRLWLEYAKNKAIKKYHAIEEQRAFVNAFTETMNAKLIGG